MPPPISTHTADIQTPIATFSNFAMDLQNEREIPTCNDSGQQMARELLDTHKKLLEQAQYLETKVTADRREHRKVKKENERLVQSNEAPARMCTKLKKQNKESAVGIKRLSDELAEKNEELSHALSGRDALVVVLEKEIIRLHIKISRMKIQGERKWDENQKGGPPLKRRRTTPTVQIVEKEVETSRSSPNEGIESDVIDTSESGTDLEEEDDSSEDIPSL